MKLTIGIFFLSAITTSYSQAACPNLPIEWDVKKASYNFSSLAGDFTVTAKYPDLKNIDCDEKNDLMTGKISFHFDLKNSPIIYSFKNKTLNKVIHTIQFNGARASTHWNHRSLVLTLPSKTLVDVLVHPEGLYFENAKYSTLRLSGANYPGIEMTVQSRW